MICSPSNSAAVKVTEPSSFTVPAFRVAPFRPEIVISLSVSPSPVSAAEMSRSMAWSSRPRASPTVRTGASATPAMETVRSLVVVASLSPSVEVTDTLRVRSPEKFAAGVICNPSSSAAVRVTEPSSLTVPALRVAPFRPEIVISLSVSLASVSAALMSRSIAWSSKPSASATVSSGASATPAMETVRSLVVVASLSPSVEVTDTLRVRSPEKFAAGVICNPSSSAAVRVTEPSSLTVPALRVAPFRPEIVISLSVSLASVSAALMSRSMAWSSRPRASPTVRTGASATPATETVKSSVLVAVSPSFSCVVTDTDSAKSPERFTGGVIVKPANSASVRMTSPVSSSNVPADRIAPFGMLEIRISVISSEPSVSVSAVEMVKAMAVSSAPPAADTVKLA